MAEDWAETRAREYRERMGLSSLYQASLAALLREVGKEQWIAGAAADKCALLAEVRRVVEGVKARSATPTAGCADAPLACDEILAELEEL